MSKRPAIVRKPLKEESPDIEAFIAKGLDDSVVTQKDKSEGQLANEEEKPAQIKLRLSKGQVRRIDELLQKRRIKVSRNVWLLEAIEEKIEREARKMSK
jgi:uncharacterized protein YwbE